MTRLIPGGDDTAGAPAWTGGMTSRTLVRPLAATTIVVALAALTGCQALGINEQYGAQYATLEDAEKSWDAAQIPGLVPDDAESIRIGYNTVAEGAMLAFTSAGGITADYCAEGDVSGAPAFEPSWWPEDDLPADGYTCGDWTVVESDGEFFVWN